MSTRANIKNTSAPTRQCSIKRHITLIEILVVISIISLIAGVVGINIRRAIMDQRFRTEVESVADTLRLAQDLMLILGTDTHVKFKQGPNGIQYLIEVENGLSLQGKKALRKFPKTLKAVHAVRFSEDLPGTSDEIDLRFLSEGSVMSRGILHLSTHEQMENRAADRRAICLYGSPGPIRISMKEEDCFADKQGVYAEQLTQETIREVSDAANG